MVMDWRCGDWQVACDSLGGRLVQVSWRGRKLLTEPHLPGGVFTPPDPQWGEYETRPVCGYDDCWPSLEVSPWPGRERLVRDHGELCWLEWTVETGATLRATASAPAGDWAFVRELSVSPDGLRFGFTCTNAGSEDLTMGWAGHALLPPGAVCDLVVPECARVRWEWPQDRGFEDEPACASDIWPFLKGLEGQAVMLVLADCAEPAVTVELAEARWTLKIEGVAQPSLGLWFNTGGYPPGPGLQRHEFGLEWMLTPECVLEQAAQRGTAIALAPHEALRWAVIWSLEEHA